MEDVTKKKKYRISDCLLIGACKEYFHEKEHSAVCDKYAQFICDQINNNNEYAEKVKRAIDVERILLNLFLEQEHWSRTFVYMYTMFLINLKSIDDGDTQSALLSYLNIQKVICQNLAIPHDELIEHSDDK